MGKIKKIHSSLNFIKSWNKFNKYNKFKKFSQNASAEETQSVAFDIVRKMEKGRMFNNRILKSVGGLVSLALMAKPIDKFVEYVIINKFVSPQIDNISALYYKQQQARKG